VKRVLVRALFALILVFFGGSSYKVHLINEEFEKNLQNGVPVPAHTTIRTLTLTIADPPEGIEHSK
jgi:hypothetical protein